MREPVNGTFVEHSQVSVSQKRIARPVVLATRFLPGPQPTASTPGSWRARISFPEAASQTRTPSRLGAFRIRFPSGLQASETASELLWRERGTGAS